MDIAVIKLRKYLVYVLCPTCNIVGFLNLGNRDAKGNQALLDLMAVLTWVKENIASFQGDPNSVTLFGHGHGAALVNFLMLNNVFSSTGTLLLNCNTISFL